MKEYIYNDLTGIPNQGYIADHVSSDMANTTISDISFHPEQKWLKVWFEPDLSVEDEVLLGTIVADSLGVVSQPQNFGADYCREESLEQQKTLSTEWTTKVELQKEFTGAYHIKWDAEVKGYGGTKGVMDAIVVLDSDDENPLGTVSRKQGRFIPFSGSVDMKLSGSHLLEMKFRGTGKTAYIQGASLSVWRVPTL